MLERRDRCALGMVFGFVMSLVIYLMAVGLRLPVHAPGDATRHIIYQPDWGSQPVSPVVPWQS